jgi:hypothetical protein
MALLLFFPVKRKGEILSKNKNKKEERGRN